MESLKIFELLDNENVTEIHLTANLPIHVRCNGKIKKINEERIGRGEIEAFVKDIFPQNIYTNFINKKAQTYTYSVAGKGRYNICAFLQRNSISVIIRSVSFGLNINDPELENILEQINIQPFGINFVFSNMRGSEIALTLIEKLCHLQCSYILTAERRIKYIINNLDSVICQCEYKTDFEDYDDVLSLAENSMPDIFYIETVPDEDILKRLLNLAEAGCCIIVNYKNSFFIESLLKREYENSLLKKRLCQHINLMISDVSVICNERIDNNIEYLPFDENTRKALNTENLEIVKQTILKGNKKGFSSKIK